MATWAYETSFESSEGYSIGELSGQQSWTGSGGTISVTNAQAFQGTQSVTVDNTNENRSRTVPDANTDGTVVYVSMRTDSATTTGNMASFFAGNNGASNIGGAYFNAPLAGDFAALRNGGYTDLGNISANTWYRVGLEFNFTADQFRVNIDGGAFSSWLNNLDTLSEVDTIVLAANAGTGAFEGYYDSISATYATASGPANLKSLDTNVKSNIKSYNTNLLANIKSINTSA